MYFYSKVGRNCFQSNTRYEIWRSCCGYVSIAKSLLRLHPLTPWLRKAGDVLCAEVSRFGRVSSNLRLPSQVSAVALDFVECWAAPKSMMKALADGLILCVVCSSYYQFNDLHCQLTNIPSDYSIVGCSTSLWNGLTRWSGGADGRITKASLYLRLWKIISIVQTLTGTVAFDFCSLKAEYLSLRFPQRKVHLSADADAVLNSLSSRYFALSDWSLPKFVIRHSSHSGSMNSGNTTPACFQWHGHQNSPKRGLKLQHWVFNCSTTRACVLAHAANEFDGKIVSALQVTSQHSW